MNVTEARGEQRMSYEIDGGQKEATHYKSGRDLSTPLVNLNPHYSQRQFLETGGVSIWGWNPAGLETSVDYSDRLREWDPDKAGRAWKEAKGGKRTAGKIQNYLRIYFEDPELELVEIVVGVRRDNGYPWHALRYRRSNNRENNA